jgi:hypothetical protein
MTLAIGTVPAHTKRVARTTNQRRGKVVDKRIAVTKVGRVLDLALLLGFAGQLVLPVVAHAKSSKCYAVPVGPGSYVIKCSTSRP